MTQMLGEQAEGDRLQGPGDRGHLGQDVDAVLVLADHALQAADLAFNAAQPPEVTVLVVAVSRHRLQRLLGEVQYLVPRCADRRGLQGDDKRPHVRGPQRGLVGHGEMSETGLR